MIRNLGSYYLMNLQCAVKFEVYKKDNSAVRRWTVDQEGMDSNTCKKIKKNSIWQNDAK